jgi:hypothetical protein
MNEEDWSFLISGVVRAVVIGYHPKNYLSQNAGTFALLFEQLKSHRNVWRLLCGLPRNSEIYENVRTLKSLFKGDFYRSLYEAEIVWELSSSRKWQ